MLSRSWLGRGVTVPTMRRGHVSALPAATIGGTMRTRGHVVSNPRLEAAFHETITAFLGQYAGDDLATAQAVTWLLDMVDAELEPHRQERTAAIRRLRLEGWTLSQLAAELEITRARVDKIAKR